MNRQTSAALCQSLPLTIEEHHAGCAALRTRHHVPGGNLKMQRFSCVPAIPWSTWSLPGHAPCTQRTESALRDSVPPSDRRGLTSRIRERLHSVRRSCVAEFRASLPAPAWPSPPPRYRSDRSSISFASSSADFAFSTIQAEYTNSCRSLENRSRRSNN